MDLGLSLSHTHTHELARIVSQLFVGKKHATIFLFLFPIHSFKTNTQIQLQIFHISEFSWTRQLFHDKRNGEQQANNSHDNIAPAEEIIFPSKPIGCCDHHGFVDVLLHVEIYCLCNSKTRLAKIRTFKSVFAGMSCSIRPYSFRKCGSAAARIQTIKCSFSTPPPLYDAE